jgi:hypothetical protein
MKIRNLVFILLASMLLWNCSSQSNRRLAKINDGAIMQPENGSISLRLANAGYYNDNVNPSNNTAEWNVVISKPGGYKVWLSSATKDTINLDYPNTVKVNLPDSQLVVIPECDKIIQNSKDVSLPYYRADSYMGSVYFQEAGEYNIQVVSEKIITESGTRSEATSLDSKLLAVILSPEGTR